MIQYDVRVPMSDGVELSCDIYSIEAASRLPVVLLRTPYGKGSDEIQDTALRFNSFGYNFVSCDVRGRGDSDGKFIPYFNESRDGFDLVEWLSSQYFSDGNIITYGASYAARIQWLTALTHPPHLKAMISIVSPSDPFVEDPTGYPSPMTLQWLFSISGATMQNGRLVKWGDVFRKLPLIDLPMYTGRSIPFWKEYFINPPGSKFWDPLFYQKKLEQLDVPVMHISGWYDDEQIGTFINYMRMKNMAATEFAQEHQAMIIGPWPHKVNTFTRLGRLDFGPDSIIDLVKLESQWIKSILEDRETKQDRVRVFMMGSNKWMKYNDWPIPDSFQSYFYLNSNGHANSSSGDGILTSEPVLQSSHSSTFDEFLYDPAYPVPFITEDSFSQIGGPDDYSEIEKRNDVLVYSSHRLTSPIRLAGEVKAELYVSTTAPDTDFTVKLVDVWPDKYSLRLTDGIIRMKYRNGFNHEDYVSPGKIIRINVDLWNTCIEIPEDHTIRIEISSSAFPKYSRNQNIIGNQALTDKLVPATQRVYHDSEHPSKLILTSIK